MYHSINSMGRLFGLSYGCVHVSVAARAMHVQYSWQSGGCAISMGVATKTLPTKLLIILNSNTQEKSVDNVLNISNKYIYSKKGIFVIKCVLNTLQFCNRRYIFLDMVGSPACSTSCWCHKAVKTLPTGSCLGS